MSSTRVVLLLVLSSSFCFTVDSQECSFQYRSDVSREFRQKIFTKKPASNVESCAKLCQRNAFCTSVGYTPGQNGAEDICSLSFYEIDCGKEFQTGNKNTPVPAQEIWLFCLKNCKVDSNATEATTTQIPQINTTSGSRSDSSNLQNVAATAKAKLSVISNINQNRKSSELDRTDAPKGQFNKTTVRFTTRRPTTPPITAKVESIFSDISKGFYKLYGTPVTSLEANGRCLRDGGFLPRFADKAQFDAFVHWRNKHEANIDHTELWLDGQNFTTGKWMWNDINSTPVTLNLWAPVPIHEALKQNCLVLGSNIAKEYDHFYATDCESIQKFACFFKGANSEDPDGDKFTRPDKHIGKDGIEFLSTLWSPPTTTPSIGLSEDEIVERKEKIVRGSRHRRSDH